MVVTRPGKRVRFVIGNNAAKGKETSPAKTTASDTVRNAGEDVDQVGCAKVARQDPSARLSGSPALSLRVCRETSKHIDTVNSASHYVPSLVVSPSALDSCAIEDSSDEDSPDEDSPAEDTCLFLATEPTNQLPDGSVSVTTESLIQSIRRQLFTHDHIVEIFGGRRQRSARPKMRSHKLPVPLRTSTSYATDNLAKNKSNPTANLFFLFGFGKNVGTGGLDCLDEVAVESFSPPKVMARREVVDRPRNLRSSATPAERHATRKRTHHQPTDQPEANGEPEGIFNFSEIPPSQNKYNLALPPINATRDQVAKKRSYSVRNKHQRSNTKRPTCCGDRVVESQHKAIPQTPLGCHSDMTAYEERRRRQAHGDQEEYYQTQVSQPHSPGGFVEIPPAPNHPLNGYSVIVQDTFFPRTVVRGFETPSFAPTLERPKPKPTPKTTYKRLSPSQLLIFSKSRQ